MAPRVTSPRASARTSRVQSLRWWSTVSRTRSSLEIFWGNTPRRVPGWREPPRRWWVSRSVWPACRGASCWVSARSWSRLIPVRAGSERAWMIPVRAGRMLWSRKASSSRAWLKRAEAAPGLRWWSWKDFAGLVDELADARGADLQQVGQHRHRAHLPLVDQGEQNAGGVVEQWLSSQVCGGTPSSAATLLGVALVGAGGLGRGQLGGQSCELGVGHAGQPGIGQPGEHGVTTLCGPA